jgi:hypothetical protein
MTVVALICGVAASGRAESAVGQTGEREKALKLAAKKDVDAKGLLKALCGNDNPEPACKALPDLSPDEAWLVLNHACRRSTWHDTPACTTFWLQRGGVLSFNLKTNDWSAQWEQASYPLKFDVTGAPTMRLKPRDAKPLKILVEDISPLMYSATPGLPKEDDLSIVAGLKSFLALAGTGIQGLVQTVTFASVAGVPQAPKPGLDFQPTTVPKGARGFPPPPPPPPPKECSIEAPDVLEAAAQVTRRHEQLVQVGVTIRALEKALDRLDSAKGAFIRAAQNAEDGKPVAISELVRPDLGDLERAYSGFEKSTGALIDSSEQLASCQPLLGAYAILIGAPPEGKVLHSLATRIAGIAGCTGADVVALRDSIRRNAALLATDIVAEPSVCTSAKLKPIIESHRDAMKPMVERLFNAKQLEEKVWTAIDKVSGARKEVLAGASVLSRQVERGQRHTWDTVLIRSLVVTRQNPELSWSKVQSHEIVMKADSPYAKEVSLARGPEEKRTYRLESSTGQLLGYGIGLIYTPLQESTYGAVAVPGGTTKVIAETKRETRAGDLAAFLSYRFMEHRPAKRNVQPTIDFGVGLTSDRPAFFLGGGIEILRASRIGFGWAPQRISGLAEGQTVNVTVVASADDIKTVKRFDTSQYYVSFTFALDSLSLFNSK